ncbi:MAG: class I SAM-dependent methyltransferase [Ardenticatenaceae bacterium]|nr:class I SAM-dependent methyltransferase [Ardenticatenaceae bacterium]
MNSVARFSSRVGNYVKYRPSYPAAIVAFMSAELGLTPKAQIADVGAGTGKLTELFLENGNPVFAVEPNEDMLAAAQSLLGDYPNFYPIAATAEHTTLPDQSADFVTAAQAFHWFDHARAKVEFRRILKPRGTVLLIWNEWRHDSPFLQAYQEIVNQFSVDYGAVNRKRVTGESKEDILQAFLGSYQSRTFDNVQLFDFEGVKGRLLSSSYAPLRDHPNHQPMVAALRAAFDEYAENGRIPFAYDCHVHYGQLDSV